jgi:hypothetical protein
MDRHLDSLNDSDYFHIFPTLIGMYDLRNYHPAEEQKVMGFADKPLEELEGNILESKRLFLLKNNINECLKAYSAEYGADYYEIKESWLERHSSNVPERTFDVENTFVGYYFPKLPSTNTTQFVVDSPFKNPLHVPIEKSVSIYTAPNEKFNLDGGKLLITPAYLNRYITVNEPNTFDMIVFTVKKSG